MGREVLSLAQQHPREEGNDGGQGHDTCAPADEARRAKERGGRRLGLPDRAHRGPRRGRYRLRGRLRRCQFVGAFQPARSDDGGDAGGVQGGSPRCHARAGELRFPVRSAAGGHRKRGARRHPPGQGGRRRHHKARRRGRLSRGGTRARARGHSGVRSVRHHAADRAAIRHSLWRPVRTRGVGPGGDDGEARGAGKAAGGGGRFAARLHQFRAGRGRRCRQRRDRSR